MAKVQIVRQITGGTVTLKQTTIVQGPILKRLYFSIPKGKVGTLTARASGASGTFTMTGTHGLSTGDVVDVYDSSTGVALVRNVVVGTVDGASVPVTVASGSLPSLNAVCVVSKQVRAAVVFAPANILVIGIGVKPSGRYRGTASTPTPSVQFVNAAGSTKLAVLAGRLNPTNTLSTKPLIRNVEGGDIKPLNAISDVAAVWVSNPVPQQAITFQLGCLLDLGS